MVIWLNLLGLFSGGMLIGMAAVRQSVSRSFSGLTAFVFMFGAVDTIANGAIVAHRLGLI